MRTIPRALPIIVLAGLLVAACGATGASPAAPSVPVAEPTIALAATVTAAPTPEAISAPPATPSPTPMPTTDGEGAEVVRGTMTLNGLTTDWVITKVGDVSQYRDGVVSLTDTMNDPRVSGIVTITFSIDAIGGIGPEWGGMTVKNDNGSWDGTCTGATWNTGNGIIWSCWLTGTGDFAGYSYYKQVSMEPGDDSGAKVIGLVYPGPIPTQ